ncbi:MAG TPA: imelysin family protein, partial [Polyangiaceae bacterium]
TAGEVASAGTGQNADAGAPTADAGAGGGSDSEEPGKDCGPPPISEGPFTRESLRGAAAACALWHFCEFEDEALKLESRVHRYAAAPDERAAEAARDAWRSAMSAWSRVEMFQFGPLSSRTESAGKDSFRGQGVRELIYAWPTVARCRVEDQIVSQSYATRGMDGVLISGRGLYALEYLLFYPGTDTVCGSATPTAKAWTELDSADISARKREYAAALATDVLQRIQGLSTLYSPEGGNFQQEFAQAVGYPNEQEALNVLAWALVYVEREVKDWKLGVPAELTLTHPVGEHEAPYALVGTENLRENLRGFRSLFQGCGANGEGLGFDDWLTESGHPELADDILGALQNAQSAADRFPPYDRATKADFQALYAAVKALTDLLKAELFGSGSPLNLELPAGVASDTD